MDLFVIFLILFLTLLWYYGTKNYNYWERHHVFNIKPFLPFFGNIKISYLFKSNLELLDRLYKSLNGKPYCGIYFFTCPVIVVRDLTLIKKILVTDFNYFVSRGFHTNDKYDPLSKNLIHINGKLWKSIRPKMQASFSLNKLKTMVPEMDNLAKMMVKQIQIDHESNYNDKTTMCFEAVNLSERYMIDVVSSCAFGIKSDAITGNFNSEFYSVAVQIFNGVHFLFHVFIGYLYPKLHKFLNLTVARKIVTNFFVAISSNAVSLRQNTNNLCKDDSNVIRERKDFLDTLIRMSNEFISPQHLIQECIDKTVTSNLNEDLYNNEDTSLVFDEDFITANVFMFFSAGYDSSARICAFCIYELATNEAIQTKARNEVLSILKAYDDNLTLEAIIKMTYLEQIVAETNRKYPILSAIFRKCDKRYQMPDGGIIEPGVPVLIPSSAIHFDPEYYPNPDQFNPDRFSEENKHRIHPSTHLPFGMGPRICVAWQFAIAEIKVMVARILSEYYFTLHPSNNVPLKLKPKAFLLGPQDKILINVNRVKSQ